MGLYNRWGSGGKLDIVVGELIVGLQRVSGGREEEHDYLTYLHCKRLL